MFSQQRVRVYSDSSHDECNSVQQKMRTQGLVRWNVWCAWCMSAIYFGCSKYLEQYRFTVLCETWGGDWSCICCACRITGSGGQHLQLLMMWCNVAVSLMRISQSVWIIDVCVFELILSVHWTTSQTCSCLDMVLSFGIAWQWCVMSSGSCHIRMLHSWQSSIRWQIEEAAFNNWGGCRLVRIVSCVACFFVPSFCFLSVVFCGSTRLLCN